MNDSNARFQRPDCALHDTPPGVTMAFLAFLASSALLGGMLGLFQMQSNATAMARAAAPPKAATGAVAVREPRAGIRVNRPIASPSA